MELTLDLLINMLRQTENGRHFANDALKCFFFQSDYWNFD